MLPLGVKQEIARLAVGADIYIMMLTKDDEPGVIVWNISVYKNTIFSTPIAAIHPLANTLAKEKDPLVYLQAEIVRLNDMLTKYFAAQGTTVPVTWEERLEAAILS